MNTKTSYQRNRRRNHLLVHLLILVSVVAAQTSEAASLDGASDTGKVDLNLLRTPSSPGFTLLDIESSTVPRPQTPSDLAVTILSETNDLADLPQDFAMEFSPYWVFAGEGADFEELSGNKVSLKTIWQSFQLSIATKSHTDSIIVSADSITSRQSTSIGAGFNVSIFRGQLSKEAQKAHKELEESLRNLLDATDAQASIDDDPVILQIKEELLALDDEDSTLKVLLSAYADSITLAAMILKRAEASMKDALGDNESTVLEKRVLARDFEFANISKSRHELSLMVTESRLRAIEVQKQVLVTEIVERHETLVNQAESEFEKEFEEQYQRVTNLPAGRAGWRLDVAGGIVYDLPGRDFDILDLMTFGGWITGGYDWEGISWLGVARVLGDEHPGDKAAWDVGTRLIGDFNPKLSGSLEAAYRFVNNYNGDNKHTWRLAMRADYLVGKNKSIAVTFGRDFEGKTSGNLISLVQLVLGFGSTRSI